MNILGKYRIKKYLLENHFMFSFWIYWPFLVRPHCWQLASNGTHRFKFRVSSTIPLSPFRSRLKPLQRYFYPSKKTFIQFIKYEKYKNNSLICLKSRVRYGYSVMEYVTCDELKIEMKIRMAPIWDDLLEDLD